MSDIETLLARSQVHEQWQVPLADALQRVDGHYLSSLIDDSAWLPGIDRLLAAFRRDRDNLQYLLIGESPYPRIESANGIAFYDAAVDELWSESGLSKAVNRATSLRNIVKTALIAEKLLQPDSEGKLSQSAIATLDKRNLVQTLAELFDNFEQAGFLLLNATPVLHPGRKPAVEARFWHDFLASLLESITRDTIEPPTLVLWGKIAQLIDSLPQSNAYRRLVCEHPYNVSFIQNPAMQQLFARVRLLQRRRGR